MSKQGQITEILKEFDPLYEKFYTWLAGQYDAASGGFYYAVSSKISPEFQPDIESTGQAVNILEASSLMETMPEKMKKQIINFFLERQTPEGYFFDPQNDMRNVERMVARAVMYSCTSLRALGGSPKYAPPGKNADTLPEHFKSFELLEKWLDARPWDYAWMAGDNIQATGAYIHLMPKAEQDKYLDFICKYLIEHQDKKTGLWGDGRPYIKLSGAFKLALFYRGFGLTIPNAELLYQSVLEILRTDISEDMCWTRNPMDLLIALRKQLGKYPEEDIVEILTITLANLKQYLKPDGGFSRHVEASLEVPNNVPLGKGLPEGDMNASTQGLRIRTVAYQLAGCESKMSRLEQYSNGFYERIKL